jgi:hypothetical protein
MKNTSLIFLVFLCLSIVQSFPLESIGAELEWSTTKQLDLEQSPLDVAIASDGATIYILSPGEVLIYTTAENRITNRIPVNKSFDRLTYSPKDNSLILSSSLDRTLEIIQLETIHDIDVAGLPFLGDEDAPVTIAVFNDYQ